MQKKNTFAKEYIKFIEEESEYYSTKLNRKKCVCITFKRNNQITVPDGKPLKMLKNVDETKPLT